MHHSLSALGAVAVLTAGLLSIPAGAGATGPAQDPTVAASPDGSVSYADPALAAAPTTSVSGELQVVVVEGDVAATDYAIETPDGDLVPLDVELPDEVTSGGEVTAKVVQSPALDSALAGTPTQDVQVAEVQVAAPVQAAVAATSHRNYVAVVTGSGGTTLTATQAEGAVDAMASYWMTEAGGSLTSFTRPTATVTYAGSCSMSTWQATIDAAKAKFPGVTFGNGTGNHLVVLGGSCGGTGLGLVGDALDDGGWAIVQWSPSIVVSTLVHEIGHNLGLDHSGVTGCAGCNAQYGNLYSVMGLAVSSSTAFATQALDSAYRDELDIDAAGEVVTLVRAAGATTDPVLTLQPRSAAVGTRGVRIQAPDGSFYWIDYRDGTGRDDRTFYDGTGSLGSGWLTYDAGVTIQRQTAPEGTTALIANGTQGAWGAGQTFRDANVTIGIQAVGATATVQVFDATGGVAGDTTAPVVAFVNPPTSAVRGQSLTFGFTVDDASASRQCRVDQGVFAACSAASSHVVATGALAAGQHTVTVRATDAAGNASDATAAFSVTASVTDTTAPVVRFTSAPTSVVRGQTVTFGFSVDDATASRQCRIDSAAWGPCTSATTFQPVTGGLTTGQHSVAVRATDAAGNTGTATATFSVTATTADTTAPVVRFTSGPSTVKRGQSATFGFSVDDSTATRQCRIDAAAWGVCTGTTSHRVVTTTLPAGQHTVSVRATDRAGNIGTSTRSFSVWSTTAGQTTAPPAVSSRINDRLTALLSRFGWSR